MALILASQIGVAVAARFPNLTDESGFVHSIEAGAAPVDEGFVPNIEAQALRSYTQPNSNLVYVKAAQPHLVAGQFVSEGDIVQVTEADSKVLIQLERGVLATDDEVAAAQKASKK